MTRTDTFTGPRACTPRHIDWVLIANPQRARLFEFDTDSGALRELAGWMQADAAAPAADDIARSFDFAARLAQELEVAATDGRLAGWVLFAPAPFLAPLRAALGPAAWSRLHGHVVGDLTLMQGAALEQQIARTLGRDGPAAGREPLAA